MTHFCISPGVGVESSLGGPPLMNVAFTQSAFSSFCEIRSLRFWGLGVWCVVCWQVCELRFAESLGHL